MENKSTDLPCKSVLVSLKEKCCDYFLWPLFSHLNKVQIAGGQQRCMSVSMRGCFHPRLPVPQIIHMLWLYCMKMKAEIWLGRSKGAQQHGLGMHTSSMAIRTYFLLYKSRERKGGPVVTPLPWDMATDLHCDGSCFLRDLGKVIKGQTLQTYIPWKYFPLISPCFSFLFERWLSRIFCHAGVMWKISGLR